MGNDFIIFYKLSKRFFTLILIKHLTNKTTAHNECKKKKILYPVKKYLPPS